MLWWTTTSRLACQSSGLNLTLKSHGIKSPNQSQMQTRSIITFCGKEFCFFLSKDSGPGTCAMTRTVTTEGFEERQGEDLTESLKDFD